MSLILPRSVQNDWNFENGKEKVWWAENAAGYIIYPTTPISPLPPGFVRMSTTNPKEMDRLFNRIHEQERRKNEAFVERLYNQARPRFEALRARLRARIQSAGVSNAEKNIIRAALKLMDERDHRMQQDTAYGVASMQETEAHRETQRRKVM